MMDEFEAAEIERVQLNTEVERLRSEIAKLKAERDLWHARALSMFWRLPDDTKCGDLRADAEKALAMLQ